MSGTASVALLKIMKVGETRWRSLSLLSHKGLFVPPKTHFSPCPRLLRLWRRRVRGCHLNTGGRQLFVLEAPADRFSSQRQEVRSSPCKAAVPSNLDCLNCGPVGPPASSHHRAPEGTRMTRNPEAVRCFTLIILESC